MITMKLLDNRFKVFKQMKALEEKLEALPKQYLKEFANEIVLSSPVDTGTYMDSHHIGVTSDRTSSHGKPHNQPYQTHADQAIERLHAEVDALPNDTSKYYIHNSSDHAWFVEYEHVEGGVYTKAKAKAQQLLEQAKRKVGL